MVTGEGMPSSTAKESEEKPPLELRKGVAESEREIEMKERERFEIGRDILF